MCNDKNNGISMVVVGVHGVYSEGYSLDMVLKEIADSDDLKHKRIVTESIKYGKLLLSVGRFPFVRSLIAKYVAKDLEAISFKYQNAKIVVLAHSFGTWSIAKAIEKYGNMFRIDCLILVGSVIDRDFDWSEYNDLEVHNFVGEKDFVVFSSVLWGTGWSGRYGFVKTREIRLFFPGKDYSKRDNLNEYYKQWGHTDYVDGANEFVSVISGFAKRKVRI